MKLLKYCVFIFVAFMLLFATHVYFTHREHQCVAEYQQKGFNSTQAEFICDDD